jgi:hypothetical protein
MVERRALLFFLRMTKQAYYLLASQIDFDAVMQPITV